VHGALCDENLTRAIFCSLSAVEDATEESFSAHLKEEHDILRSCETCARRKYKIVGGVLYALESSTMTASFKPVRTARLLEKRRAEIIREENYARGSKIFQSGNRFAFISA